MLKTRYGDIIGGWGNGDREDFPITWCSLTSYGNDLKRIDLNDEKANYNSDIVAVYDMNSNMMAASQSIALRELLWKREDKKSSGVRGRV